LEAFLWRYDRALRPWKEITADLCKEKSSERLVVLCKELDEALAAQTTVYRDKKEGKQQNQK